MEKIYMTIAEASEKTGLSQYYLRKGCRADTVPHIKSGNKYLINVAALLEKLDSTQREVNNGGESNGRD